MELFDPRISWGYAIAEARKGRPALLARMVVGDSKMPDDVKRDVESIIAKPARPPFKGGGRPPRYTVAQRREIVTLFRRGTLGKSVSFLYLLFPRSGRTYTL